MYLEDDDSTFTHDGKEYNLNVVLIAVKGQPIQKIPVKDLEWVLPYTTVLEERVEKADLKAPILVALDKEGRVTAIDGAHRLMKAHREGVKVLPAKWVSKKILKKALIKI